MLFSFASFIGVEEWKLVNFFLSVLIGFPDFCGGFLGALLVGIQSASKCPKLQAMRYRTVNLPAFRIQEINRIKKSFSFAHRFCFDHGFNTRHFAGQHPQAPPFIR